jgi:hypothetical protein
MHIENITNTESLRLPRGGLQPQHQVFERLDGQRAEAGIDALGVGLEQRAVFGAALGQHAFGHVAEAMHAHFAIGADHRGTDDFGQFTGRVAPQQVHLEKTVLTVGKSQGVGRIEAVFGADGGNAQRVALDGDRRRNVLLRDLAVELGKLPSIGRESRWPRRESR